MNAYLRTAILLLAVLGLAACASTPERSVSAFVAPQRALSIMGDDEAYIARVEQVARRRGVEVVWINLPRKPVARQDD